MHMGFKAHSKEQKKIVAEYAPDLLRRRAGVLAVLLTLKGLQANHIVCCHLLEFPLQTKVV